MRRYIIFAARSPLYIPNKPQSDVRNDTAIITDLTFSPTNDRGLPNKLRYPESIELNISYDSIGAQETKLDDDDCPEI